jgi:pimeloyl-ACP methyl ester carboxylesterase
LRNKATSPLLVLSFLLLVVLIAFLAGELLLRNRVSQFTTPQKENTTLRPDALLLKANDISFATDDHVNLHGWLIQGKPGCPIVIMAHNYGSNRSDMLGNLENLIAGLNKLGYFVLLFDFRGHGDSGSTSALGLKEAADLQGAMKAVLKYRQIDKRMGVLGVGMGALAAAQISEKLDEVKIVVLDSVYEDISERVTNIIMDEAPFTRSLKPAMLSSVNWHLKSLLNVPSMRVNLLQKMPLLYPKAVVFVEKKPLRPEVKKLYESAREPKELLLLDETAVGPLIGKDRDEYSAALRQKIRQYLPPTSETTAIELKE